MRDNFAKARMQFRCAAGEVEGMHRMRVDHLVQQRQALVGHRLGACRPCIHVAMQAALVAAISQVDLQGFQVAAANRRKGQLVEQREHGVHDSLLSEGHH
ncbi:hypothetical protein D9M68_599890 [compost metagenome]